MLKWIIGVFVVIVLCIWLFVIMPLIEEYFSGRPSNSAKVHMNSVLGKTSPDPWSDILGTGFLRFESSTGISGLVKEVPDGLEILAVLARDKRKGCFRKFIAMCKEQYSTVYVWEVDNPFLPDVLTRYGFTPFMKYIGKEKVQGYRWIKFI